MDRWALSAAIGFVSGVLSGAFGIGGGIVTTPAIRLLMGAPALIAVGTPLPVIVPGAITGALSYHRRGLADLRYGAVLGSAGALTAVAGALLATRVGGTVVLVGTSAILLYAAVDTILQVVRPAAPRLVGVVPEDSPPDGGRPALGRGDMLRLAVIGALTGVYSGFFGLGGGFVLVPMLTRWMRLPVKQAIGTSLVTVAILAIPGTVAHSLLGNVEWAIVLGLVVGVVPGALVGARITQAASDTRVRIAFAVLLVVVAIWLAVTEIWAVAR